jgi:hypothetical protein
MSHRSFCSGRVQTAKPLVFYRALCFGTRAVNSECFLPPLLLFVVMVVGYQNEGRNGFGICLKAVLPSRSFEIPSSCFISCFLSLGSHVYVLFSQLLLREEKINLSLFRSYVCRTPAVVCRMYTLKLGRNLQFQSESNIPTA